MIVPMSLPYLVEKEFKQMMRNIILPLVFLILPLAMMNVVPRLLTQEVRHVRFVVVDNDHSTSSERLVHKISASPYFDLVAAVGTGSEGLALIESGDADLVLQIAPRFEREMVRTGRADISLQANAVDGTKSGLGASYATQIINAFAAEIAGEQGAATRVEMLSSRFLYNVNLDYKTFMIPALMGMVLVLIVGFLPALNIVGEKERGTIEQINVTPVGKVEFILSKLIPYWTVGLVLLLYCMVVAHIAHGVSPRGSVFSILLFATLFLLVISSLGLFVSNISDTTQQASLVMFFFLMVFMLMSGMLTPVTSMPSWAQTISWLNPFRWFMEAMRAVFIKESGVSDLIRPLLCLSTMALVLFPAAVLSYRKQS